MNSNKSSILLKRVNVNSYSANQALREYRGDYDRGLLFYTRNNLDVYIENFLNTLINNAAYFKIRDNMGNIIFKSEGRAIKRDTRYPNLLSVTPINYDFIVEKEDISKYSSFTIIP